MTVSPMTESTSAGHAAACRLAIGEAAVVNTDTPLSTPIETPAEGRG